MVKTKITVTFSPLLKSEYNYGGDEDYMTTVTAVTWSYELMLKQYGGERVSWYIVMVI